MGGLLYIILATRAIIGSFAISDKSLLSLHHQTLSGFSAKVVGLWHLAATVFPSSFGFHKRALATLSGPRFCVSCFGSDATDRHRSAEEELVSSPASSLAILHLSPGQVRKTGPQHKGCGLWWCCWSGGILFGPLPRLSPSVDDVAPRSSAMDLPRPRPYWHALQRYLMSPRKPWMSGRHTCWQHLCSI